jgi:hypothetical protein
MSVAAQFLMLHVIGDFMKRNSRMNVAGTVMIHFYVCGGTIFDGACNWRLHEITSRMKVAGTVMIHFYVCGRTIFDDTCNSSLRETLHMRAGGRMATVEVASGPGSRQEPCWEDVYSII